MLNRMEKLVRWTRKYESKMWHINQVIRLGTFSSSLQLDIGKLQGHVSIHHFWWSVSPLLIFQQELQTILLVSRVHVKGTFANLLPITTVILPLAPHMLTKHELMRSQKQVWQRQSCIILCHLLVQLYSLFHDSLEAL